ncbi:hypothetical protein N0V83_001602 [Neocucurbitaria cava]|uniref:Uncharacterized protein n=1 Tax=Neocucurbitaria cava TaxID=798079 RepID=A0A9W8YHH2_9PLEO|nr:hypothetical protein N0V83_001602 [Neocucurbitaria cava]
MKRVVAQGGDRPAELRTYAEQLRDRKFKRREYTLDEYRPSMSKPQTLVWTGRDEQENGFSLEHNLSLPRKDLTPYTLHHTYEDELSVSFQGAQNVVIKQNGRIVFDESTVVKYTFVNARDAMRFHEDLRARKNVACVPAIKISSAKELESRKERSDKHKVDKHLRNGRVKRKASTKHQSGF